MTHQQDDAVQAYLDAQGPVANEADNLRQLLTSLYVAVRGHLYAAPALHDHDECINDLLTSVLDAAEGRPFTPVPLPWPARTSPPLIPAEAGTQV